MNKNSISILLWVHTVLAALSLTFFFCLFSAGILAYTNCKLIFCIFLFTISLAFNAGMSIAIKFVEDDLELATEYLNGSLKHMSSIGIWTAYCAIFCLILFYSTYAGILFILLSIIICILIFKKLIKAMNLISIKDKERLNSLEKELDQEELEFKN